MPIWFEKLVNNEIQDPGQFMDRRREMFSIASTNCLPDVIQLSQALNDSNLTPHIQYFANLLGGLPARLSEIYSVYRLFANEVQKNS